MDLGNYLSALPSDDLDTLFSSPWTCQAVLRSLSPVAQYIVLRQLHVAGSLPDSVFRSAVLPKHHSKLESAITELQRLNVLQHASNGELRWLLHPGFSASLRSAVSRPAYAEQGMLEVADLDTFPERVDIDAYADRQWQQVLLMLFEGRRRRLQPHKALPALDMKDLFMRTALTDEEHELTAEGYRFLFLDTYRQLWLLLKDYLSRSSSKSADGTQHSDALSFLFQLSFKKVLFLAMQRALQRIRAHQPLVIDALPEGQRVVAAHLAALGILMPVDTDDGLMLCPTFLASMLCGSSGAVPTSASDVGGFIIVETSFRVIAYTSSPVQIEIISLFAKLDLVVCNMCAFTLTARSVREAVARGVTSQMILSYLEEHRHPKVAHRTHIVPEAVRETVQLWESELNRVHAVEATLFEAFDSRQQYESTLAKAQALDALLFRNDKLQRFVADASAFQVLRAHIKRLRDQQVEAQ